MQLRTAVEGIRADVLIETNRNVLAMSATSTPDLASAVLDADADRQSEGTGNDVLFADELLPGVGDRELTLREGLAMGGSATFVVLMLLVAFDELEGAALAVLAPDIRDAFNISDGAIVFMSTAIGGFIVLGALPFGWLADRYRRGRLIGAAGLLFSSMVLLSGLAVNAFMFFWTRAGVGLAKSSTNTVHASLLADAYPIGIRGRISAANASAGRIVGALSPLAVGGIAAVAGGTQGWRWAFLVLGLPTAFIALFAFRLKEPVRGQYEMLDVLGEVVEEQDPAPTSIEAGFARLLEIRTLKTAIIAFAALGFGLFTGPVLSNLFMEEEFGLTAFERGLAGTLGGIGVLFVLPFVGRYFDRLYRRDPSRALALVGLLVIPSAVLTPMQYFMPNAALFAVVGVPNLVLLSAAFTMVGPVLQAVVPYRLRGIGGALAAVYIFFVGALGGGFLSFLLIDAVGPRNTVLAIIVPSSLIGGLLLRRSSTFIRNDLSMIVADLRDELDEHRRQLADPSQIPALQIHDVDFAYGSVQVLFGVSFEVARGEVLALLGTNGAGKSTILRVAAGLGTPSRGVVRLHGRNVTYTTPEQRQRMGVQLLPGGKGVFPAMTVLENLEIGAFAYRNDKADRDRRIERVMNLFPVLRERTSQRAGSMSGGEQQMLAMARVLLHEPEVLLIDELSLGLAPVVVRDLIGVVERLKAEGMTIVLVEQSLNVAVSVADRAVFLEKGRVRFDGAATDLLERDDLARAVFLGDEGG